MCWFQRQKSTLRIKNEMIVMYLLIWWKLTHKGMCTNARYCTEDYQGNLKDCVLYMTVSDDSCVFDAAEYIVEL